MDAAKLAAEADLVVAVVGLGNTEAEGVDRYNLTLPGCPAARMPLPKTGCPGGPAHDQNALLKGESLEPGGYAASRSHSNGSTLIHPARGGAGVRAAMTRPNQKLVLVLVSAGQVEPSARL